MGVKLAVFLALAVTPCAASAQDAARYADEASHVTITRDDWGIAHIHGQTDADAVFGMIYAQCEDDFQRVEANYLTALGRTAEAEGEKNLWQDLRQRLFLDPAVLRQSYEKSPSWLRQLMDAWADGLNFYLSTHPEAKPRVLTHFEPWMALSFTEGSIGGDIERVDLKKLEAFYTSAPVPTPTTARADLGELLEVTDPYGSNGFAIASANTARHHALLYINPHTPFFFRSELQMTSDQGLDAYGAVTWGQFFVYQGFNERAGWMHTSSGVDAVDEYVEQIHHDAAGRLTYRYGTSDRPVHTKNITLSYKTDQGLKQRTFTTYATSHGPVIDGASDGGGGDKWITIQLMNLPLPALEQSYSRTKARNYAEYSKAMELKANSSNNTVFADADGDIAYWHGNFIPRRDPQFDFSKPVDGTNPATDWHGLLRVAETPHLKNPASGYLFNVNNWPWSGAGASSLRQADFPAYVEQGIETARGQHAMRIMAPGGKTRTDWTRDAFLSAAFDSYLPWFGRALPPLLAAWDKLPATDARKAALAPQIALLRAWDERWAGDSVATSLAIFWGTELLKTAAPVARAAKIPSEEWVATHLPADQLLAALEAASGKLQADFGKWQTPWGEINRFQRLTADIVQPYNDAGPSIPVPLPSSLWGSLAAFNAHPWPGTKRWYGYYGNSFVAIVEFGDKVSARAVTAGGESGHVGNPHFDDEMGMYTSGNFREVYFYPEQLKGHTERKYKPGE